MNATKSAFIRACSRNAWAFTMTYPITCFGQQPRGLFPRRFLYAKIITARRLKGAIGGEIVFFFHDGDHNPRETQIVFRDTRSRWTQSILRCTRYIAGAAEKAYLNNSDASEIILVDRDFIDRSNDA